MKAVGEPRKSLECSAGHHVDVESPLCIGSQDARHEVKYRPESNLKFRGEQL